MILLQMKSTDSKFEDFPPRGNNITTISQLNKLRHESVKWVTQAVNTLFKQLFKKKKQIRKNS